MYKKVQYTERKVVTDLQVLYVIF